MFLCSTVYQVRRLLGRGEPIPGIAPAPVPNATQEDNQTVRVLFMTLLVCDLRKQKNHAAFVDEREWKGQLLTGILGRPALASTVATLAHLRHAWSLSIVGAYQRPATRTPLAAKAATHDSMSPLLRPQQSSDLIRHSRWSFCLMQTVE